jgi:hypothetical protein
VAEPLRQLEEREAGAAADVEHADAADQGQMLQQEEARHRAPERQLVDRPPPRPAA